jgi:hypothetical protein
MITLIRDPLALYGFGLAIGALAGFWLGWCVGRFLIRWG